MNTRSAQVRFFEKVNKTPTCWLWTAGVRNTAKGYGAFVYLKQHMSAHRASYLMFVGAIPPGYHVLHRCDVPACVNPEHLFIGTNADNVRDKVAKGRQSRTPGIKGEASFLASISNATVVEIKKAASTWKGTQAALAKIYGISQSQVSRIWSAKTRVKL